MEALWYHDDDIATVRNSTNSEDISSNRILVDYVSMMNSNNL